MSEELDELQSRLIGDLQRDEHGLGPASMGLKIALYELEHLSNPWMPGTEEK